MSKYLLALDPGKASGVAIIDMTDQDNPIQVYSGELQPEEFYAWILAQFKTIGGAPEHDLESVVESFTITPQTGKNSAAPWSLEHIGILKFLCWLYGVSLVEQTPARAKSFMPNERMKNLGFWHKGGAGHANDALRHGALYLVVEKNWRPKNLLSEQ